MSYYNEARIDYIFLGNNVQSDEFDGISSLFEETIKQYRFRSNQQLPVILIGSAHVLVIKDGRDQQEIHDVQIDALASDVGVLFSISGRHSAFNHPVSLELSKVIPVGFADEATAKKYLTKWCESFKTSPVLNLKKYAVVSATGLRFI